MFLETIVTIYSDNVITKVNCENGCQQGFENNNQVDCKTYHIGLTLITVVIKQVN